MNKKADKPKNVTVNINIFSNIEPPRWYIPARAVRSARYITFKLCSSCPYKNEFYETLENIRNLQPKLE